MPPNPVSAPRSKLLLRVYPNVYHCYDHERRLSAAVRFDPGFGRKGEIHHVGSVVTTTVVEARGEVKSIPQDPNERRDVTKFHTDPRGDLRDTTVKHALVAVSLPHTDYHVRMLKKGALFPADAATAALAKVPLLPLVDALKAARARLVETWKSEHPGTEPPDWPQAEDLSNSGGDA